MDMMYFVDPSIIGPEDFIQPICLLQNGHLAILRANRFLLEFALNKDWFELIKVLELPGSFPSYIG